MAKVKITARFQILELIDRFIDGSTANAIGRAIVDEAKTMISEGVSPVRGHGRFERYKDRKKYPGKLKSARPVNLNLTGEMLKGYSFRPVLSNQSLLVGMVKGSVGRKDIAEFHNAGTEHMAMRRFIPQDDEEFAVRIMRKIRDLYGERLRKLISQSNNKK